MIVGRLTVENRTDCVTLYGSLDVTRDQLGLARARALLTILTAAVQRLEGEGELPAILPPPGVA